MHLKLYINIHRIQVEQQKQEIAKNTQNIHFSCVVLFVVVVFVYVFSFNY